MSALGRARARAKAKTALIQYGFMRLTQPAARTPAHRRACASRVVRECDAILINLIKRESQACLAEGEGVGRRFYR